MSVKHKGDEQMVFIYSLKEIKKASELYFNLHSFEYLTEYGFCLVHLIKK